MNHPLKNRTRHLRRGITLLEVLISMFVALVGLAGLASLFWLGGIEMSEGVKFDRALAVGRAAQRSFKILGMHRPIQNGSYYTAGGTATTGLMQTWVTPNSNTGTNGMFIDSSIPAGTPAPVMPFSNAPPNYWNFVNNGSSYGVGNYTQGFAIDPIGVIANNPGPGTNITAFPPNDATGALINVPPQGGDTTPCLARITLMAFPALSTGQTTPNLWPHGAAGQTYSSAQADLVFRSQDDLLINPPNGDFPPTQLYSTAGRRQSQGDYSWLATVVPGFSSYEVIPPTGTGPPTYIPMGDPNLVRVSIVVFYKRNPTVLQNDMTGLIPPSERMVTVATATATAATALTPAPIGLSPPTGIAGGEVQLQSPGPNYLNLKPGQWIMLSQAPVQLPFNGNASPAMYSTYWYRWYKVVAAGALLGPAGGVYYRGVTLSGPDWNPDAGVTATSQTPVPTYASIFDGAVAVFEKEIELEQSGSPFSPN